MARYQLRIITIIIIIVIERAHQGEGHSLLKQHVIQARQLYIQVR